MREFDLNGLRLAEYQAQLFEYSAEHLECSSAVFLRRFLHSDLLKILDLNESSRLSLDVKEGIEKIEIQVEGIKLTKLPKSKKALPEFLDKEYGINKKYELTSLNDVYSYTVYYVNSYNDESYYTPVTKYINSDNQDKVKIIIDELATSMTYESNLMSFLNTNVKLLDYEVIDNKIKLNFNNLILSDITSNVILEEVMYTIGLSLCDELDVEEVIFQVENEEIATFSQKILD